MGKQLAIFISYAFHPLWMPLYMILIFWNINQQMLFINNSAWLYILLVVFMNTLLIPVMMIWLMKRLKVINDIHLHSRKDRIYPFLITGIFYLTTWYLFHQLELLNSMSLVFKLATILVSIALLISLFWKISIHSMSMGAMSAAILYLAVLHFLPIWPVYIVFILSGLVGFARLKLKAHQAAQIYVGYVLGLLVVSVFFLGLP